MGSFQEKDLMGLAGDVTRSQNKCTTDFVGNASRGCIKYS